MADSTSSNPKLKKELKLFDVFALATGATLSAGLFLLPGTAFAQAGPAMIFAYILAAVPMVPSMLCIVELSTAMPRSGGAYYFLERSLGPLVGTVGGIGTWLALILKTSFALVGLSAYVSLYIEADGWANKALAVFFAIVFGCLNLLGSKKTGGMQQILVVCLLVVLALFMILGLPVIQASHFENFFGAGGNEVIATAGMVYISYVGVTKVASVAEEVSDPEKTLPRAVFLSFAVSLTIYILATTVMVGVLAPGALAASLTPMADSAFEIAGPWGKGLVSGAAILAFFSVCNAGLLASSRYPMAMSRDGLMPELLGKVTANGVPRNAVILTSCIVIAIVLGLDVMKIAKLASAFQLLIFALLCGAVIVMRESGLDSYDPGYKTPFYPWIPLFGTIAPFALIFQMGWLPSVFTLVLIGTGVGWYLHYGRRRVDRRGAIFHVFARLGEGRHEPLDTELRTILKEKGLRESDPFEQLVIDSIVIDWDETPEFSEIIQKVSLALTRRLDHPLETFVAGFTEGTQIGATPVSKGVALPHMRLEGIEHPFMVLVRLKQELRILAGNVFGKQSLTDGVHAAFFLVSPEGDASMHLRILAQLATRIDEDDFMEHWLAANSELQLREVFLRDDRYITVAIERDTPAWQWAGLDLSSVELPDRCLVATIRRHGRTLVPRGSSRLLAGDRLLIFGEPDVIAGLYERFA